MLRIRTRLLLGYSVGVLLFLVVGSIGLYSRQTLSDALGNVGSAAVELDVLHKLTLAVHMGLVMPPNNYVLTADPAERTRFDDGLRDAESLLSRYGALAGSDRRLLDDMRSRISELRTLGGEIFSLPPDRLDYASARLSRLNDASRTLLHRLRIAGSEKEAELESRIERGQRVLTFVSRSMMAGAAAVLILGVLTILYLDRMVRIPVERLSDGVKGIGAGRWTKVEIDDDAEIGRLAEEFNAMVDRLSEYYEALESKVAERTRELEEANRRLEILAVTDGLTGLYNHRYFYERLAQEFHRTVRYGRPLSFLMIDIDRFKEINDTHGHMEGDKILCELTRIIRRGVRETDIAARYGGEEFAVILPEIDKEGAAVLGERLRLMIENHDWRTVTAGLVERVTVSIGIASWPDDAENAQGLVAEADRALYEAKQKGRNRVVMAHRRATV
ncbi:MAG TPA: diguanylate cyclase [Deltaproteobacteria bacterium]|nr:diguanylate cyclase [Deltaproteobacteria bacterium]